MDCITHEIIIKLPLYYLLSHYLVSLLTNNYSMIVHTHVLWLSLFKHYWNEHNSEIVY